MVTAPTPLAPSDPNARARALAFVGACLSGLTLGLLVVSITLLFVVKVPDREITINGEQASAKQAMLKAGGALLDSVRNRDDDADAGVDIQWKRKTPMPHRIARWMLWACIPVGLIGSVLGGLARLDGAVGPVTWIAIWPFIAFLGLVNAIGSCSIG